MKENQIKEKCKECQFENGKHSFECSKYKEPKNPMKKEELNILSECQKEHAEEIYDDYELQIDMEERKQRALKKAKQTPNPKK